MFDGVREEAHGGDAATLPGGVGFGRCARAGPVARLSGKGDFREADLE